MATDEFESNIKFDAGKFLLGAAGTNPDNLGGNGALNSLNNVSPAAIDAFGLNNFKQAVEVANLLKPKQDPFDPNLAMFLFFTKMGEAASKPGATALGAASIGAQEPLKYLMAKQKEERAAQAAVGPLALQLSMMSAKNKNAKKTAFLNKETNQVEYYNQQQFNNLQDTSNLVPYARPQRSLRSILKTVGSGTLAKYLDKDKAKEFVIGLGLPESAPNFASTVDKFIAPNKSMVGQTITDSGVFLEVVPLARDGEVINLQLTPSKTAAAPRFQLWVEKRLPLIAKATDTYSTTAREVIPRVEEAMALLRGGTVETGGLSEKMLPFKQVFNQAFGIKDSGVMAQETLQATSNYLAPKMRAVGSGSTSDMEFKAYQRSILSLGNTPQANYISLYAFKKMAENGVSLNQKEMELLTSDRINSASAVNKELNKIDKGIFEKYTGSRDNPKNITDWLASLPNGAVIINNNLFSNNSDPYVIKGWGE